MKGIVSQSPQGGSASAAGPARSLGLRFTVLSPASHAHSFAASAPAAGTGESERLIRGPAPAESHLRFSKRILIKPVLSNWHLRPWGGENGVGSVNG